ncbi:hypothetical protein [Burkholderia sp. LMG 21824]|uniref:hypothetical protein n=1 Tax=Burkholderia sp. LMG 21824 TaxID=3158172 RepID=UPI003C2DE9EC
MNNPKKASKPTQRRYGAEGAVHLYSSLPTVLTPADLYRVRDNAVLREAVTNCNIYLIASRRRILIDPADFSLDGNTLSGNFLVQRVGGMAYIPFEYDVETERIGADTVIEDVAVALSGTHLVITTSAGQLPLAAYVIVASARAELDALDRDLDVLYIGQGIGRTGNRTAIDRLLNHSTLQRILAEATTFYPEQEILLLLYRFEHQRIIASTGGDMTVEPMATREEEHHHMERMHKARLNRHAIVSLAEAGLIRHFQPAFNVQVKMNDFAAKRKLTVLQKLLTHDLTGLIVEIGSGNIRSRLRTPSAPPPELPAIFDQKALDGDRLDTDEKKRQWAEELHLMAHTQYARHPLTTPQERDTFLHGTLWNGETERTTW